MKAEHQIAMEEAKDMMNKKHQKQMKVNEISKKLMDLGCEPCYFGQLQAKPVKDE